MGKYKAVITDREKGHLSEWKRFGQKIALMKIGRIIGELAVTPYSGIGSPEPLKYNMTEYWSRQTDKKNHIIYQVKENVVNVFVISAKGHYGDK